MRILITGGAGFIGTHLRKKLLKEGHQVRVFDSLLPQVHGESTELNFTDCEFILGDARDRDAVEKAVTDIEVVYHLAAETGVGQSQYEIERYVSTNTYGTAVVLQAAGQADVGQIIISSSRAVYGDGVHKCEVCDLSFSADPRRQDDLDVGRWEVYCSKCSGATAAQLMRESDPTVPTSLYGLTKLQQEQLAAQVRSIHKLPVTILRLFNVYGPGQSLSNPYVGVLGTFFRQISAGNGVEIYEDGEMRRDFVYVGDVTDALLAVAGNERAFDQVFNVGSGTAVTLAEAGREMFKILEKEPRILFSGRYRLGDIHHAVGDIGLIQNQLKYSPGTSFSEGLKDFVSWAEEKGETDASIDGHASRELAARNLLRESAR